MNRLTMQIARVSGILAVACVLASCASSGPRVSQVSGNGQETVIELSADPGSLLAAKPVSAAEEARKALKERKDASAVMMASVAELTLLAGKVDEAAQEARELLKKDFRNVNAMRTLVKVLITQKKYSEAIMMASNSLQVHARDADLMSLKGLAHYLNGEIYDARGSWQEAVRMQPGCVSALMNLGALYFANGSPQLAGAYFEKALLRVPNHLDAQVGKALVLSVQGKESEARTRLEVLVKEYPESSLVLYNLAVIERDRFENYEKSIQYVDKYIKVVESQRDRVERAVAMREEMKVELARKNQSLTDEQVRQMAQKSSQAVQQPGETAAKTSDVPDVATTVAPPAKESSPSSGDEGSIDALEEAIQ